MSPTAAADPSSSFLARLEAKLGLKPDMPAAKRAAVLTGRLEALDLDLARITQERQAAEAAAVQATAVGEPHDGTKLAALDARAAAIRAAKSGMSDLLAGVNAEGQAARIEEAKVRLQEARTRRIPAVAVVLALAATAHRLAYELGLTIEVNGLPGAIDDSYPEAPKAVDDASDAAAADLAALGVDWREVVGGPKWHFHLDDFLAPGLVLPAAAVARATAMLSAVEKQAGKLADFDFAANRRHLAEVEEKQECVRAARKARLEAAPEPFEMVDDIGSIDAIAPTEAQTEPEEET